MPLYTIVPEPLTRAFKFSLATTFACPDPEILTSVSLEFNSKPLKLPLPITSISSLEVVPESFVFPEPAILTSVNIMIV
ncbi:hypothetical protein OAD49_01070 [Flavobacteriaceae bacterium]|nr:hypothetical protein [Flavobacteriaceae bacterium]MDB9873857.1 hypothetical protein [Flavobacteriaceae bacterium]MDB9954137.1 hypothetical protein [Flavobacteriaceae bacterium]